jgi:hypothetical protein
VSMPTPTPSPASLFTHSFPSPCPPSPAPFDPAGYWAAEVVPRVLRAKVELDEFVEMLTPEGDFLCLQAAKDVKDTALVECIGFTSRFEQYAVVEPRLIDALAMLRELNLLDPMTKYEEDVTLKNVMNLWAEEYISTLCQRAEAFYDAIFKPVSPVKCGKLIDWLGNGYFSDFFRELASWKACKTHLASPRVCVYTPVPVAAPAQLLDTPNPPALRECTGHLRRGVVRAHTWLARSTPVEMERIGKKEVVGGGVPL